MDPSGATDPADLEARFELLPRGCFIALVPGGVLLGLRRRGLDTRFVPYAELTHVEATRLGLWLATTRTTQVIRRSHFVNDREPDELVQAIRWRLGEAPDGEARLKAMRAVAERALEPRRRRATLAFVALCLGVFALQWMDPFSMQVGVFYPELVNRGEFWRVVTGNLLHGRALIPLHLIINVMCLLAFGALVERPLGAARTFVVMGVSGLVAMLASAAAGYGEVLGASGVVAGLVGAVLWLEFNAAEHLPAWWRIPRRVFIAAVLLQGLIDQMLPFIAAAAHLGGLLAGFAIAPFAARGVFEGRPAARDQRLIIAALALGVMASLFTAGQLIRRDPGSLANHGRRLLSWSEVGPSALNDLAWRMATESKPDPDALQVATELAERAVDQTGRLDPNVLDTLAEVLFVSGRPNDALGVIDEAILLTGGEIYFHEQRRRFTGERAADDRPDPPTRWILPIPRGQTSPQPGISI
jgi:membrane associated rhomboid family serine protease